MFARGGQAWEESRWCTLRAVGDKGNKRQMSEFSFQFDGAAGKGAGGRAVYACCPATSKGRLLGQPDSPTRSSYQRDRDRILHSAAFRRLKHKTQVFVYHEGDHYRTRLTHSLEVSQIARSLARVLGLDEDLAEMLALAHDLGHPPFGHAGEAVLADKMAAFDGFDHNVQTFRIVTKLEGRYAEFDGLNLTWEAVEGLVKHNGPVVEAMRRKYALTPAVGQNAAFADFRLADYASLEAQVAAISDDIAYNAHDVDDGLSARLFTVDDIQEVPLLKRIVDEVRGQYADLELTRLVHEVLRRLITQMVDDVIAEAKRGLARVQPGSADDVRGCGSALAKFSEPMAKDVKILKTFLMNRMYRHYKVNRTTSHAKRIVAELFDQFLIQPQTLPTEWSDKCDGANSAVTGRVVCDYIAGMTDRYALQEHKRLFSLESWI